MNDWYRTSFRRNLVDMHIQDWDERFLRDFSPEDYVANLRRAKIQTPMLYYQAHTGHCYWPTKVGHMHTALRGREDLMRRLTDLCHAEGMTVVGYYSVIYNNYEEDRHPQWRLRDRDGLSMRQRGARYGTCCPNNGEYRAFVREQIREMSEYFSPDGMFYDMLFWPQFCWCDDCRARWRRETGLAEPPEQEDWHDPVWRRWVRAHQEWMGEFAAWIRAQTEEFFPGLPVEQNYASGVAGNWTNAACELVNDACDYTGGDLYGDLYNHSFAAKYYHGITKQQPFEYMTCRCESDLSQHTVMKTEERLSTEVLLTAAHHGASLVIDAIDPIGTQDSRVYDLLGRVFDRQIPYEPYFDGTLTAEAGVYYPARGRFDGDGQGMDAKDCAVGAVRMLVGAHIAADVLSEGYPGDFGSFPLVLAPGVRGLTEGEIMRLCRYVENGGSLYLSGGGEPELLRRLLGAELLGMTESNRTYIAPTPEGASLFGWFTATAPMPYFYPLPMAEFPPDVRVLATLTLPYTLPQERRFASIHSNPPGEPSRIPTLVSRAYGKGRVLWSAACPETDPRWRYRTFFLSLVGTLLPEANRILTSDAPRQVELVLFRRERSWLLSAVDLLWDEEKLPVAPFRVTLRTDFQPTQMRRLPDGAPLAFTWEDGRASFCVPSLRQFDMFELL